MIFVYVLLGLFSFGLAMMAFAWFFPRLFIRAVFKPALHLLYRAEVHGLENFPRRGPLVVACNHVSWIDGILLLWLLPRNIRFVVDSGNFRSRFMSWMSQAFDTIMMGGGPKSIALALREARDALSKDHVVGIFPEGTITRSGQLQAFRGGLKKIVQGNEETLIVPCFLEGMWGSIFSFSGGKLLWKRPEMPRRKLRLFVGKAVPSDTPLSDVRESVQLLGAQATSAHVVECMIPARRLLRSLKKRGKRKKAVDLTGEPVSGANLLLRSLILRRILRRTLAADEKFVGVLLPPSVGGVAANAALAFDRRVAVNLNYTATPAVIHECIAAAGIKRVLTSKRFMSKLDIEINAPLIYLEDLPSQVTTMDKIAAAMATYALPSWILERLLGLTRLKSDELLTVIFTSGSTGLPKGVMLTHGAVAHNIDMIDQAVRLRDDDAVIGILPFFHSFGYAVTLWSVMCLEPAGLYHFNPLDARHIGKLAKEHQATVILATPTFLRGYLRRISAEDFKTLDVVVVGAEKMPLDLFDAFEEKYGVRPVEGYGMTEMGPLVSVNIPPSRSLAKFQPDRREGSVGRPLPGVACRIVSADNGTVLGCNAEGLLEVRGPNLMQGYLGRDDLTRESIRDGWYQTGDLARIDDEGFLHITGRQSRFSKIGGEMVPHGRVEEILESLLRDEASSEQETVHVVVTAVPDDKKGERLVVLHLPLNTTVDAMRSGLMKAGLPNLYIPSADCFFQVDSIPLLGTGKLDLKRIRDLGNEFMRNRKSTDSDDAA